MSHQIMREREGEREVGNPLLKQSTKIYMHHIKHNHLHMFLKLLL